MIQLTEESMTYLKVFAISFSIAFFDVNQQVDKPNDGAGDAHLIMYLRYIAVTNVMEDIHIILQLHSWKSHIE